MAGCFGLVNLDVGCSCAFKRIELFTSIPFAPTVALSVIPGYSISALVIAIGPRSTLPMSRGAAHCEAYLGFGFWSVAFSATVTIVTT